MIFFDFSRSVLTRTGRAVVEDFSARCNLRQAGRIVISAYADGMEHQMTQTAFGSQRAMAIYELLTELNGGRPVNNVDILVEPLQHNLHPNQIGQRDPQNRVVILRCRE
jgi:outer membrane protein OmpA-like peptidoglycan-associated protein